jgi:hypothetical protein
MYNLDSMYNQLMLGMAQGISLSQSTIKPGGGSKTSTNNVLGVLAGAQGWQEPRILGFIKEEGVNVLMRSGQAIGGAGQALLGGAICYGSGGLACAGGVLIGAKGIDNFQAGIRGADSVAQKVLIKATGSEKIGTLINAGIDLGTSVKGLTRSVPKISAYGTPYNTAWYKGDPGYFEPAFKQATTTLRIEALTATGTIISASQ